MTYPCETSSGRIIISVPIALEVSGISNQPVSSNNKKSVFKRKSDTVSHQKWQRALSEDFVNEVSDDRVCMGVHSPRFPQERLALHLQVKQFLQT